MATHSCILAWKILWTEEPGRLLSTGLQTVRPEWVTKHTHTHACVCITKNSYLGSSIYGILQARILEWVAILFSRESSQPKDRTHISCSSSISRRILYLCITWEALSYVIRP